jgi:hypothetical protein
VKTDTMQTDNSPVGSLSASRVMDAAWFAIGKLVSTGSRYRLTLTYVAKLAVWIIGMGAICKGI